ncbi:MULTISPECIES: LppA family lipoprotein [Amycolatopsis]|uniref:LppA family lipoprotein n=1 Tax=Amycolatopsis TaxID=1813 RepID=UPI0023EA7509|nr:LppA family lipoprotein [Amycolatopsis nivea]
MDRDPAEVWAALMRLPDTDQARQQYQQLDTELRQALTAAIPKLTPWTPLGTAREQRAAHDSPASATTANRQAWATTG